MERKIGIKRKIIVLLVICILAITALFCVFIFKQRQFNRNSNNKDARVGELILELNELVQLFGDDSLQVKELENTIVEHIRALQDNEADESYRFIIVLYIICICIFLLIFGLIYVMILRPFDDLKEYAEEVANGNLEKELKYKRINMFGDFTWAFDHMRSEIIRSRKCEAEAIENNKTVIATLSHDIKTPVASIRGYAEALTMNMDSSKERRERFAEVIIRKCDDVTKITNDLFLHSIHDLDKLSLKQEEVELADLLKETIEALSVNQDEIIVKNEFPSGITIGDTGRIAQVIENIIANSRKYAVGSKITMDAYIDNLHEYYVVTIEDEGNGIPDADMPFIFNKFYRGANVASQPGAGLGLFIVKFIMEQMQGNITLTNKTDGLLVELQFKLK